MCRNIDHFTLECSTFHWILEFHHHVISKRRFCFRRPGSALHSAASKNISESPATGKLTFTAQESPLLRIPGELRNKIYEHVFDSAIQDAKANWIYKRCVILLTTNLKPRLGLLSTCHQIRHEASLMLFKNYLADMENGNLYVHSGWLSHAIDEGESLAKAKARYIPDVHHPVKLHFDRRFRCGELSGVEAVLDELSNQMGYARKTNVVDAFLDHIELMAFDIAEDVQMMSNDLGEDHIMDVANLRAYGFRYKEKIGDCEVVFNYDSGNPVLEVGHDMTGISWSALFEKAAEGHKSGVRRDFIGRLGTVCEGLGVLAFGDS